MKEKCSCESYSTQGTRARRKSRASEDSKGGRERQEDPTPADVEIVASPSRHGDTLLGRRRRPQGTAGFDKLVVRLFAR